MPTCPTCEHAWIDATIDEAKAAGFVAPEVDTGGNSAEKQPFIRRHALLIGLAVAVVAVYATILLLDAGSPAAAPAPTTSQPQPATTAAPPTTSAAPTTSSTTSTTTTTTSSTTTTTIAPIVVVEPAFDVDSLTLGAFALGPVQFGDTDPDLPGRLAATFGQPDAVLRATERWGLCEAETGRVLVFGYFAAIFRDTDDGEQFVGYRQRWLLDREIDPDHPSGQLRTISGLVLADPLSRATDIYSRVTTAELAEQMDQTTPPGTPIYLVQRSSDGRTLIWGRLSGDADPRILSINSPNSCDAGPTG